MLHGAQHVKMFKRIDYREIIINKLGVEINTIGSLILILKLFNELRKKNVSFSI